MTLVAVLSVPLSAQGNFDDVRIETIKVADGIYMLVGSGGNIGLSTGEDAAFLIDDQYAPLTEKITKAVAAVSTQPVKFLLNTHWHGDHTGGNENFGKMGTLIVAHENVRKRMSTDQFMEAFGREVPASPSSALPVVTFNDTVTFHLNNQEIRAFHVPPAHTDGDTVIHFRDKNVLHTGDLFFNGTYPFIDLSGGGSAKGMIEAAASILLLSNADTKIIPGHGPLADRTALKAYRDMLEEVVSRIDAAVQAGKSQAEVVQMRPTQDYDEQWGQGFMNPERFVQIVYDSLKKEGSE
jgi:glyoxylase-like metal-dependent hydrolase (beta-lactamase superfamily II)